MTGVAADRRDVWTTILIFLAMLTPLAALFHLAIVKLMPTSFYVGPLMWTPAVAAFITLRIRGRGISSMPWKWGTWRHNRNAYLVPILYIGLAYTLIWATGLGGVPNVETLHEWAKASGLDGLSAPALIGIMVVALGTIGCIRAMSTIVGEEIGWRGFLVWELRKVLPFGGVALVSGLIWSAWHWPIVFYYGGGDPYLQIGAFTVMIVAMSVVMAYFTFRSASVWPAILFHAAHNVFYDKLFDPLTVKTENTGLWSGEYGLMMPLTASLAAIWFWRKARSEGM